MIVSVRAMVGQDVGTGKRAFQAEEPHKERQTNSFFFLLKEVKQKSLPKGFNLHFQSLIKFS